MKNQQQFFYALEALNRIRGRMVLEGDEFERFLFVHEPDFDKIEKALQEARKILQHYENQKDAVVPEAEGSSTHPSFLDLQYPYPYPPTKR